MPIYDFRCTNEKCGFEFVKFFTIHTSQSEKEKDACPKCGASVEQTFRSCASIIISETNDEVSAKPGSYWDNAENVKQTAIRKRQAAHREKLFYKDKETIVKEERRKQNAARFDDED